MTVATTILNNNNVVRTIKTSDNNPQNNPDYSDEASAQVESMDQNESDDCDSGSRDISTVNTNRLKQIFDTYRNGVGQNGAEAGYQVRTQKNAQKIAVYDMGMART